MSVRVGAAFLFVAALAFAAGAWVFSWHFPEPLEDFHLQSGLPVLRGHAPSRPQAQSFVTRVDAQLLIPGLGDPITDGTLIFSNSGQILFAGQRSNAPELAANATLSVPAVMPGLWDCHTHFGGPLKVPGSPFKLDGPMSGAAFPDNYIRFYDAVRELQDALAMGITSVREVGGPFGQALHELLRRGGVDGPHFHYSGRAIGMTAGHTDEHTIPPEVFRWMDAQHDATGTTCDGVPECLKRVRENLRMQADAIKVMTSGGALSEFDDEKTAELSDEEIAAITAEAKRSRRAVAAHAHGTPGIQSAIVNGVTSIEHGTWMTQEQAEAIIAKGYMVYTPTAVAMQEFWNATERPPQFDEFQWQKGQMLLKQHSHTVRMAIAKKVPIVVGTDCPMNCSQAGNEVNYLHLLGMTPLEAIRAGTAEAPKCMGQWGLMPKSGLLAAGYDADVLALSMSPLEDLKVLTRGQDITHVWLAGKLVKQPQVTEGLRTTLKK